MNILVNIPFDDGPISNAVLSETKNHKPWVFLRGEKPDTEPGDRIGLVRWGAIRVVATVHHVEEVKPTRKEEGAWKVFFTNPERREPISDTGKDVRDFRGWKPWDENAFFKEVTP